MLLDSVFFFRCSQTHIQKIAFIFLLIKGRNAILHEIKPARTCHQGVLRQCGGGQALLVERSIRCRWCRKQRNSRYPSVYLCGHTMQNSYCGHLTWPKGGVGFHPRPKGSAGMHGKEAGRHDRIGLVGFHARHQSGCRSRHGFAEGRDRVQVRRGRGGRKTNLHILCRKALAVNRPSRIPGRINYAP